MKEFSKEKSLKPDEDPYCFSLFLLIGLFAPDVQSLPISTSTPDVDSYLPFVATARFDGSVQVHEYDCCLGGIAGEELDINIQFSAESPYAPVTEMRVSRFYGCASPGSLSQNSWQPFLPEMVYTIIVPIGWSTFNISVQYRDELGNVSGTYCDFVIIEGMPPPHMKF